MNISLTRFLRTGYFGEICSGSSSEDIQVLLGSPEASAKSFRKHRHPDIWLYGGVEFWLDQSEPQDCRSMWIERIGHGWQGGFKMPANTVTEDWGLLPYMSRDAVETYLQRDSIQRNSIAASQLEPKKPGKTGYIFASRNLVISASGVTLGFDEDWRLNALHASR